MTKRPTLRSILAAVLAGSALTLSCDALASTALPLRPGAEIRVVTNLADNGPGSLRAALSAAGPAAVVFEVGGYIELAAPLIIATEGIAILGETAPGSGVVLRGATLKVRASNVLLSHIAVFAGSVSDPEKATDQDSISIFGSISRENWIRNVTLRHVTAGWAVDENLGVQGLVDGLRIERSLIAEGLRRAGHPKITHSMNLLIGNRVRRIEIVGNVFASSDWRSARMTPGNLASMTNNAIVGYGAAATQIDPTSEVFNAGAIDVLGNVYLPTADSNCKRPIVAVHDRFFAVEPATSVHLADNMMLPTSRNCKLRQLPEEVLARLSAAPGNRLTGWTVKPAASLWPSILEQAGARPAQRNPIDSRIVASLRNGTGRIPDNEASVGGWPTIAASRRALDIPASGGVLRTADELRGFAAWICRHRKAVGDSEAC